MSTKVKTGEVRFSFAHIFEPHAFNDDSPKKYSLSLIIPKSDKKTLKAIEEAYKEAVQEGVDKFGKAFASKASPLIRPIGSNYGLLKDADQDGTLSDNPAYQNSYIMALKSNTAPQVLAVETGKGTLLTKDNGGPDIVYSGCYGKVTLTVYPFSKVSTGVTAALNNVLKTKDGQRFNGWKSAAEDFGDDFGEEMDDDLL